MMSGSWRRKERRPAAKVRARLLVDLDLRNAGKLVLDRVFDRDDILLGRVDLVQDANTSVVVFPEPVGPVVRTMPFGCETISSRRV